MEREDEARFYIGIREKGRSQVCIGFKYESERRAFLEALNKKYSPWDLYINLWEAVTE